NYDVVKAVVEQIVKHSPKCIIIVVTNPLDAMAQAALKVSGFPKNRVLGMAGVLDSARMSTFVAMECKCSVAQVHSFVLAGHGDGEYGIKGLFVGVPVKLGANGVEEIIQIKLTSEENAALQKSSTSVRELVTVLGL